MNMNHQQILAAIIAHRERSGMTQREAADNYGCKPIYWNMVERGKREAKLDVLVKMAEAVGLQVEILVAERPEPPKETKISKRKHR